MQPANSLGRQTTLNKENSTKVEMTKMVMVDRATGVKKNKRGCRATKSETSTARKAMCKW